MTMTGHLPWLPKYVLHEFSFKSLEEQSNGQSQKWGFICGLKTGQLQNSELADSSMEVPK